MQTHTSGRAVRGRGACRGPAAGGAAPAGAAAGAAVTPHLPGSQACPLERHGRCRQETHQILSCRSEVSSWCFRLAGCVLSLTSRPAHAGAKKFDCGARAVLARSVVPARHLKVRESSACTRLPLCHFAFYPFTHWHVGRSPVCHCLGTSAICMQHFQERLGSI